MGQKWSTRGQMGSPRAWCCFSMAASTPPWTGATHLLAVLPVLVGALPQISAISLERLSSCPLGRLTCQQHASLYAGTIES